ncbi:MAG TPA: hypothetical protein VLD37_00080 [Candidatus Bilamarchaeum sp.]|nr:hypothetical protein [Candidatus Bilamarchaeum sp.]
MKLSPISDIAAKQPFEDNVALARMRKLKVAGNLLVDGILAGAGACPLPCPLMALPVVAYAPSGQAFSSFLEYISLPFRYCMDTGDFRGERRIALAFEDFDIRPDGRWKVFHPRGIRAVPDFPQESMFCGLDPATGVPSRSDLTRKRFAMRLAGARIGPIIRDFGDEGKLKLDVFMHHRPSYAALACCLAESNVIRLPKATG